MACDALQQLIHGAPRIFATPMPEAPPMVPAVPQNPRATGWNCPQRQSGWRDPYDPRSLPALRAATNFAIDGIGHPARTAINPISDLVLSPTDAVDPKANSGREISTALKSPQGRSRKSRQPNDFGSSQDQHPDASNCMVFHATLTGSIAGTRENNSGEFHPPKCSSPRR